MVVYILIFFYLVPWVGRDSGRPAGLAVGEPAEGYGPPLQEPRLEGRQVV